MFKYSRETKDKLFRLPGAEINRYPDLILRWTESLDKIEPTMLETQRISQHTPNINGQDEDNDNDNDDVHEVPTEEAHKLPADIDIETKDQMNSTYLIHELNILVSDKKLIMTSWRVIALITLVITTADGNYLHKRDLFRTFEDSQDTESSVHSPEECPDAVM